jgi:hypothetical protein
MISRMTFCGPAGDDPLRALGADAGHLTTVEGIEKYLGSA